MKRFKQVMLEGKLYHTSYDQISSLKNAPMWFAHNDAQAKGWHNNTKNNNSSAYTYEFDVRGKIANYKDRKVKQLFIDAGIDQFEYENDLVGNPSAREVLNHEGTKLLQKNGYIGYVHSDYDPLDFQRDHDSTVIFDAKKHVRKKSLKYDN